MSAAQSIGAITRWEECEKAARILGCGKTHVHDKLYSRMKREGLLALVIDNVAEAVDTVKAWPEFQEETVRMWQPVPPSPEGKPSDALSKLKVARWFVNQMGSFEKAHKALTALEHLDESL